jgi:hypothetical protein
MLTFAPRILVCTCGLLALFGCSHGPDVEESRPPALPKGTSATNRAAVASPAIDTLHLLTGRIWRVTSARTAPAKGAIFIFLADGMLLETSCVEPYRVAAWSIDTNDPHLLRVVEDGLPAFSASITEITAQTLRWKQKLKRQSEPSDVTFTALDKEYVCPDLPK